jgi:hypothetical protein
MVFVGSDDEYLYAINVTDGSLIWRYKTNGTIRSSPAVAEAQGRVLILVGSEDGRVYTLSKNGGLYWSYQTGGAVDSSPAIVNGTVFVGSNDGNVYAFRDLLGYTVHDIAVIRIEPCKTIVGQSYSSNVNVIVENQGNFLETFNVTVYANTTVIGNQKVNNMLNGTSTVLSFSWNTNGVVKGNYTLWAYALPVPEETDTSDNTFSDGIVTVVMPGDANGDGIVEMMDFFILSQHYMHTPPDDHTSGTLLYHECFNADVNSDGTVEMMDFFITAQNYMKTDP